jgi:GT2 family glycosyltransferase
MQKVDLIFLANTVDEKQYGITQRAINTLRWSEDDIVFNIIIVETNANYLESGFVYHDCNVITPSEEFHYNKYLNHGLKQTSSDWIVVANNDVIFTKRWMTNMLKFNETNPHIKSMSPYEPNWHPEKGIQGGPIFSLGYRASYEVAGWCIVFHRSLIELCDLFDERFKFWYQDNDYGETLKSKNIQHALVGNSRVYHMVSQSYETIPDEKKRSMMEDQYKIFYDKWNTTKQP